MKQILILIGFLCLSLPVFAQAGQATRIARTDPTGTACDANSPVLEYQRGKYTCESSAYRLSSPKQASYTVAQLTDGTYDCTAARLSETVLTTTGNRAPRTCTQTSSGVYKWVAATTMFDVQDFGVIIGSTNSSSDRAANKTAIEAAITAAAAVTPKGVVKFPKDRIFTNPITWQSGVKAQFDDTTITGVITTGNLINLENCTDVTWLGTVTVECENLTASGDPYLIWAKGATSFKADRIICKKAAIGVYLWNADNANIRALECDQIWGTYPSTAPHGDGLVITSSKYVSIGNVSGNVRKVGVYLALDDDGNESITIESVNIKASDTAEQHSAVQVRQVKGLNIGSIVSDGSYRGLLVQKESTDTGYTIKGITIGEIVSRNQTLTNGVGVYLSSLVVGEPSTDIVIGSIYAENVSANFLYCFTVSRVKIGKIVGLGNGLNSQTLPGVAIYTSSDVEVQSIQLNDVELTGVEVGLSSTDVNLGEVVLRDISTNTSGAYGVRADTSARVVVNSIDVAQTIGNTYVSAFFTTGTNYETNRVKTILRSTSHSTAPIIISSQSITNAKDGRYIHTAAPTNGVWALGDTVWNSAPAALGVAGWICTTAGTPGTWSAFYLGNQATGTSSTPSFAGLLSTGRITISGANNQLRLTGGGTTATDAGVFADGSGNIRLTDFDLARGFLIAPTTGNISTIGTGSFTSSGDLLGATIFRMSGTPQTISGNGAITAINLTTDSTLVVTTGAATTTLAAGAEGQRKRIKFKTDGGDCVITVTNLLGGTTVTLDDANDFIQLEYLDGHWIPVVNVGCTIA